MVVKYLGRILTTYPGPESTRSGNAQNRARMTWFCTRNLPTLFGVHFLSFPVSTAENVLVEFWWLLWVWTPPVQAWSKQSWKPGPNDFVLHLKHIHNVWGAVLIVSPQYGWELFQSNFDDFFGPRKQHSRKSWKPGTNDLVLHSKHTHIVWGVVFNVSRQYSWKMFQSNFDNFFGFGHDRNWPGGGKVENWARLTPFCTRNILTMLGVQFLSFPISTAEKCFRRILMTFLSRDTTGTGLEQAKLKTGPEWLHFAPETHTQCLGCNSYPLSSLQLKNVSVKFWWLFRVQTPPEQDWSRQSLKRIRMIPFCSQNIPTMFGV